MSETFDRLEPLHICDVFKQVKGDLDEMWDALGPATIGCMADGCRTLAMLWSSAWAEAGTGAPHAAAVPQAALRDLYLDPNFAPSLFLTEMVEQAPAGPAVIP